MRVAITGTTSGIGLRAAAEFVSAGHDVIALGRSVPRTLAALEGLPPGRVTAIETDLADPATIRAAAQQISGDGPLDALILNAAVFDQNVDVARHSVAGHELFWATNHLGPFELTARLSGALAASGRPRVLFVASKGLVAMPRIAIRFDDLDDHSWFTPTRAYYHAKLAQVMIAMSLAESAGDQVAVSCLRVPSVRLDAPRLAEQPPVLRALYAPKNALAASPERLAATYRLLIEEPERRRLDEVYVDERRRTVRPPAFARDPSHRDRLWSLSQRATGDPGWAWPTVAPGAARPAL